jgi:hypothetical protein
MTVKLSRPAFMPETFFAPESRLSAALVHDPEKACLRLDPRVETGFPEKIMLKKTARAGLPIQPKLIPP